MVHLGGLSTFLDYCLAVIWELFCLFKPKLMLYRRKNVRQTSACKSQKQSMLSICTYILPLSKKVGHCKLSYTEWTASQSNKTSLLDHWTAFFFPYLLVHIMGHEERKAMFTYSCHNLHPPRQGQQASSVQVNFQKYIQHFVYLLTSSDRLSQLHLVKIGCIW